MIDGLMIEMCVFYCYLADVAGDSAAATLPPALADDRSASLTNDQEQTTLVAVGIIICRDSGRMQSWFGDNNLHFRFI